MANRTSIEADRPTNINIPKTIEVENIKQHANHEDSISNFEKEIFAVCKKYDDGIPSNEGYILDEPGGLTRKQSIAANAETRHESKKGKRRSETNDTEMDAEKGSLDDSEDPNIVWWDGLDDPENPMNFGSWVKFINIALVSTNIFIAPLASSMFAPGVPQLMVEFKSNNIELASFVVSVYLLGFAFGPLLLAPLSEIYGRLWVYHICNAGFLAFTIACAISKDLNMLIVFRLFAGTFGSAPITNGGGTIADLITQEKRGRVLSAFVLGPIIGPVIGPVAGGYLSEGKGWRWVFWLLAMLSGACSTLCIFFLRETYAPVILSRKTARLRKTTGNPLFRSKLDIGLSPKDFFIRSIIRPVKMLIFSPIILATSIYCGLVYGYLYLLFTTFTLVFEGERGYGFSTGQVGLTFMGVGGVSVASLVFFAVLSDKILKKMTRDAERKAVENGGVEVGMGTEMEKGMKPEYRLPLMVPGSALIPIGLLLYGWTAHYHVHYIIPILATALIGIGNISVFMCITTYLVDAFTIYAASALAANSVIRSFMGAVLPLCGQKMYLSLGLGWGNSLLAFVAIAGVPMAWGLVWWGESLRRRWPVRNL